MNRGGKREGAGRPRKEDKVAITIRINNETAMRIKEMAMAQGKSQGEIVEDSVKSTKK